jgi:hypothetical protein
VVAADGEAHAKMHLFSGTRCSGFNGGTKIWHAKGLSGSEVEVRLK